MKQFLRTIGASALLLATSTPVLAQGSAGVATDITAIGSAELRHYWLDLRGPDAQGNVVARVRTADLDLTTTAGLAERDRRVSHASGDLCRTALDDPDFSGSQIAAERSCLRGLRSRTPSQTELSAR